MRMTAEAKNTETPGLHVRRQEGPLAGVIILLFTSTILATFSIVGDLLQDGMTLSQEDISLSCPMTATVRTVEKTKSDALLHLRTEALQKRRRQCFRATVFKARRYWILRLGELYSGQIVGAR
jgi:hypothetical protein